MHVATNHEIETFSGLYVDTSAPDPDTIRLEDIAHALANTCRFGGHARVFYSVAEHAVRIANKLVIQGYGQHALAGLHHDDSEAYLIDIPRPLKPLLGDAYRELTVRMDSAIARAFGGLWEAEDLAAEPIRWADEWALRVEAMSLLPSKGDGWTFGDSPWRVWGPVELGWPPEHAEDEFIRRHNALKAVWA